VVYVMSESYPTPSYALSIWLSGHGISIAIPEAGTIIIPLGRIEPQTNEFGNIVPGNRGVAVLLDLLRERAKARPFTIGMSGAPVRNDVEKALESDEKYRAWLVAMNEDKAAKAKDKAEAEKVLSEIGL
jgi:hypothetical protein